MVWTHYRRDVSGAWQAIEDLRDAIDAMEQANLITSALAEQTSEQQAKSVSRDDFMLTKKQVNIALAGLVIMAGTVCASVVTWAIHITQGATG